MGVSEPTYTTQPVAAGAPRVRNGSLAIVLDPGGAPIALQKYPY